MRLCYLIFYLAFLAPLLTKICILKSKEALSAKKAQGITLGKPKGTIQKSKFDKDVDKIKELLGYGLSIRKMAKVLGYTNPIALNTYIKKRGLNRNAAPQSVH